MQTFVPILETIWFINSNICPGVCSKGDVKAFLHCIRAESPAWHSKAVKSFSTSNSSPNFNSHLRTYSRPLIATHICKIVLFCLKLSNDPTTIDENFAVYNKLSLLFCISNCAKSSATFKHVWNVIVSFILVMKYRLISLSLIFAKQYRVILKRSGLYLNDYLVCCLIWRLVFIVTAFC